MKFYKIILKVILAGVCSTALAVPPIQYDRATRNNFGGYNYYRNGVMVNRSHKNNTGSETIYGSKGVEYRGYSTKTGTRWYPSPSKGGKK